MVFMGKYRGAREMAQQITVCLAFPKDLSSNPMTHLKQLTTTCNSSSKLLPVPALMCTYNPHIHIKNKS